MASNQDFADSEGNAVGREQAADKVREENLELQRRLSFTPSMLSVIEPDGRYTWVNDAVLQYFGLSLADVTSDDLRRRVVHPDDFQRVREERQRTLDSGQYRWFLIRYRPLKDSTGSVVRWYGSATDIEDGKRAKEVLHLSEAYSGSAKAESHLQFCL